MRIFLLIWLLAAVAQADILLKATMTSTIPLEGNREARRTTSPVLVLKDGDTAMLELAPKVPPGGGRDARNGSGDYELQTRFKPTWRGGDKVRLELTIQSRFRDRPWQKSKVEATLLEGEAWEATIEDPTYKTNLEYRVTLWKIPPGQHFLNFDSEGKPRFSPNPSP